MRRVRPAGGAAAARAAVAIPLPGTGSLATTACDGAAGTVGCGAAGFLDVTDELIATPGNRDDEPVLARRVVEHLAERRDVAGEVVLLDHRAVPDVAEDVVLFDDAVPALQQQDEDVEGLRGEGDVAPSRSSSRLTISTWNRSKLIKSD